MAEYAMKKTVKLSYDETLKRLPEVLKEEGFGILTEIDVKETMKKKLDVDFRRYRILGACNPPFAHQALTAEIDIGVMMPCNVVVYEGDDGKAVVSAIDPMATIATTHPGLNVLAGEVRFGLERALSML
jgi:uncharacterized protein (DUF302 family)